MIKFNLECHKQGALEAFKFGFRGAAEPTRPPRICKCQMKLKGPVRRESECEYSSKQQIIRMCDRLSAHKHRITENGKLSTQEITPLDTVVPVDSPNFGTLGNVNQE